MRISSKGRYGLASMICMAASYTKGDYISIISIAENLDISKIYLEQVFSLLKRANVITSIKGSQGGYKLTDSPDRITVFDVLFAIEQSIFEKTEASVAKNAENIEMAMQKAVFNLLDNSVEQTLKKITLSDLVSEAEKNKNNNQFMFYI